jgi:trimeric autotransporter adhesin
MKRTVLFLALSACSFGAIAQTAEPSGERCVSGTTTTANGYNNYEAAGGSTGPEVMADGTILDRNNISIGQGANANGSDEISIGTRANTEGFQGVGVGANVDVTGDFGVGVGQGVEISKCYGVGIGDGANVQHRNSVALGGKSATTRENEVNVGNRQIGGVNDATLDKDAVNLRQMRAADAVVLNQARNYADLGDARTLNQAKTYSDLGDVWTLNQAKHYTDEKVKGLHKRIDRMGAMSTAMSMMTSSAAAIPGKSKMAVGMGFTNGEPAVAIGYQRAWLTKNNRPMSFTVGAAFARKERSVGAGLAWGLK